MVEVIVPFRDGGCPHRLRAFGFVLGRWAASWGDVVVAKLAGDGPWIKADAAMPAIERSAADVVILADADVVVDQGAVESAVRAVTVGAASWAMPHDRVFRLTREATDRVLADRVLELSLLDRGELDREHYQGRYGGGIVIGLRETLIEAPLDRRFEGWGQEDESWGMALAAIAGPCWRGTAPLVHLWHPPAPRWTDRKGSPASWALRRRYRAARRDPTAMRALLASR